MSHRFRPALLPVCLGLVLTACAAIPSPAATQASSLDMAAAQATALVQQAEATAVVLRARAVATAMIERASTLEPSAGPAPTVQQLVSTPTPAAPAVAETPSNSAGIVEVVGVGFGTDGGLIAVQFRAPPRVARDWWQGAISVMDEATQVVYNEIVVLPKVGPLISRPAQAGQVGYVMLVNAPQPLRPGALVTVVLGDYRFEHIRVK